jgi:hypothetical protein
VVKHLGCFLKGGGASSVKAFVCLKRLKSTLAYLPSKKGYDKYFFLPCTLTMYLSICVAHAKLSLHYSQEKKTKLAFNQQTHPIWFDFSSTH